MLREPDVRAIIRLLGEVSVSGRDLSQKKRRVLSGLCEIVDGDRWAWSLNRRSNKNGAVLCLDSMSDRCPSSPLPDYFPTSTQTSSRLPNRRALSRIHRARLRLTVRQIADEAVSSISIFRLPGRLPFTQRETRMVQIVLSEIPWLHEQNTEIEATRIGIKLPPRQYTVLVHLMDGLSRQTIAERLHISPHTVHGHIKDIFKHYSVNSRAALVRQFTLGWQPRTLSR